MVARARAWWPASHTEVLDAASELMDCTTPMDLEDATCDLIGRHWRRWFQEYGTGLHTSEWLDELLQSAAARADEPAVRRLLHGITVIAPPELADAALDLLTRGSAGFEEPAWLAAPATVTAAPEVLLLREAYGMRFGLLAQVTGASEQPRTYLFDVDLCHGFLVVLTSGYHPDTATATAVWRDLVGASAADAEPVVAPADLLTHLLPDNPFDGFFAQPLTEEHYRELYRGGRVGTAIADALHETGHPLTAAARTPEQSSDLAYSLATRFRTWAAANDTELPPATGVEDDVVAWMIQDWVTGSLPEELQLPCSPHRIAGFTAYLVDDWQPDPRDRALAVLEPWARFCLENTGVTGPAAEHTLAWARRAAQEPEEVGGNLGNHLTLPVDETTVVRPQLPDHDR
jgi:hypothetical protein